jgi:glucose/arabinose dehydrogenase
MRGSWGRSAPRRFAPAIALVCCGCASGSNLHESATVGASPTLVEPDRSMIPTIEVVDAVGWQPDQTPAPAEGLRVTPYARLSHPRWLHVLPNGDVLVAETDAPERPKDDDGLRGRLFKHYQKKAGGGSPSPDRISLLRDRDGDGLAELQVPFLVGLTSPFGMALVGDTLYVANTDAVVRVPYAKDQPSITDPPVRVLALPAGERNHHWTKNIVASPGGQALFIAIGSNSNAAEHGLDEEKDRAQVWRLDLATGTYGPYATGLRNPVGMAWEPTTGALWVAVNERDELGPDLVPDYMTAVREGGFYGWPFSYFGAHLDPRLKPPRPDVAATAIVPDYALGAHTASLGLAYAAETALGRSFSHGMFVGQHGSWNRRPRSGYKVVFVPFRDGRPDGPPRDVLAGFVTEDGDAMGRPVGVAVDGRGGLLVADDVGGTVWRVFGAPSVTRR